MFDDDGDDEDLTAEKLKQAQGLFLEDAESVEYPTLTEEGFIKTNGKAVVEAYKALKKELEKENKND